MGRQKQRIGSRFMSIHAEVAQMAKTMPEKNELDILMRLSDNTPNTLAPPLPLFGEAHLGQVDFNTLVAPLSRLDMCHQDDVHQGQVTFSYSARLELHRVTAAPPLLPSGSNAVPRRLLVFLPRWQMFRFSWKSWSHSTVADSD